MLNPGERVAQKYRVIRLLGEGGMGAVYECEHEAIQRHVAIKVLFPQFATDPEAVLRFHREAQAAGRIGHDNICEVTDIGQLENGAPFLVMPLLKGDPLSAVIGREAPMSVARAVDFMSQVLDALAAAHQAGIVHRDLKPDNLYVTHLGSRNLEFVKVLDFGISKVLGNTAVDDHKQVTRTGMVMGTPCYMAPEQARGLKDVDHRADLYAVGAILFEMLTGRRAFDGESFNDILIRVVIDPLPLPRQFRPDLPPEVEAVIVSAMSRDRLQRPQTADEFRTRLLAAFEAVKGALPASAPGASPPAGPTPSAVRSGMQSVGPVPALSTMGAAQMETITPPPPSRRGLFVGLGAALVLVAAAAAFFALRGGGDPPAPVPPPPPAVAAPAPAIPVPPAPPPPAVPPVVSAPPPAADAGVPPAAAADAAPPPAATVKLTFDGLPEGARVKVAGLEIEGAVADVPRAEQPLAVEVAARGFETFRTEVIPSGDRTVPVELRRTAGTGRVVSAPPPRDAGSEPPPRDAGTAPGRDAGTVSGRLGTTLINAYDEDAG